MRYALNIFDKEGVVPVVLVINIDGFFSRRFCEDNFTQPHNSKPYYRFNSQLWGKEVHSLKKWTSEIILGIGVLRKDTMESRCCLCKSWKLKDSISSPPVMAGLLTTT